MQTTTSFLPTLLPGSPKRIPTDTHSTAPSTVPLRDGVHWLQLGSHTELSFRLNLNLILPASRINKIPSIYLHF